MEPRVLIVSDLHLGAPESDSEAPLVAFLDHHLRQTPSWTLVVNGDGVDLFAVRVMPQDAGVIAGLSEDDHAYGLGSQERAAVAKLGVLLDRVPLAVAAIARFVGAGHTLIFVAGNHDAELAFSGAQDTVRAALVASWKSQGGTTTDAVGSRIHFRPWFVIFPGTLWLEHGHQYDPYCSFDDPLSPASEGGETDLNVDSAVMRYLVAGHAVTAKQWDGGFLGHIATLFSAGRAYDLAAGYCQMVRKLVGVWAYRLWGSGRTWRQRAARRKALRAAASDARIPAAILGRIRGMHRPPLVNGLVPTLRAVMADRLVAVVLVPVGVLIGAFVAGWTGAAVGAAAVLAIAGLVFSFSAESVDPRPNLRRAGRKIRRLLGVRYVINGHTHAAESGSGVLNTGTWLPGLGPDGCTYVRFDHGRAELLRWTGTTSLPYISSRAESVSLIRTIPVRDT